MSLSGQSVDAHDVTSMGRSVRTVEGKGGKAAFPALNYGGVDSSVSRIVKFETRRADYPTNALISKFPYLGVNYHLGFQLLCDPVISVMILWGAAWSRVVAFYFPLASGVWSCLCVERAPPAVKVRGWGCWGGEHVTGGS